jgi:hypothetical protein
VPTLSASLPLQQGGELELTLLLGDPSVPKGVSAVLGTIELPEGASGAAPKPKLLTARHQPVNNIKPNIAHTFVSVMLLAAAWQHYESRISIISIRISSYS